MSSLWNYNSLNRADMLWWKYKVILEHCNYLLTYYVTVVVYHVCDDVS